MDKFTTEDILPMVFRFLVKAGYTKAATKLQSETELDLASPAIGLHKKKLVSIIDKDTIKKIGHKKSRKNSIADSVGEQAGLGKRKMSTSSKDGSVKGKKKKGGAVVHEEEIEEEEEEAPVTKSSKNKKLKEESKKQNGYSYEEAKPKAVQTPAVQKPRPVVNSGEIRRPSNKRIDENFVSTLKTTPFDSQLTFQDKLKHGKDEQGQFGWDRLGGYQGKEFRKQKHKLKNKTSYVGALTMDDNTIPFE